MGMRRQKSSSPVTAITADDDSSRNVFDKKRPFLLTPFHPRYASQYDAASRRVLHSMTTLLPNNNSNDGEVEVSLEEECFVEDNDCLSPLLHRRVVVRSPGEIVHASFALPANATGTALNTVADGGVMCWTTFSGQGAKGYDQHYYLCVLASPALLCIFDPFPRHGATIDGAVVGEGYTVPLPFEASAIYSLCSLIGTSGINSELSGLLIQRAVTAEDLLLCSDNNGGGPDWQEWDNDDHVMAESVEFAKNQSDIDEEDEKIELRIHDPPNTVRLAHSRCCHPVTSTGVMHDLEEKDGLWPQAQQESVLGLGSGGSGVPSLFTLSHYLDEIRPCMLLPSKGRNTLLFEDVCEVVVFVGTPRLFFGHAKPYNSSTNSTKHVVVATYNTKLHRHAIWTCSRAPSPPDTPPLWRQTADNFSNFTAATSNNTPIDGIMSTTTMMQNICTSHNAVDGSTAEQVMQMSRTHVPELNADKLEEEPFRTMGEEIGPSPCFSDLHPDYSLTCIYVLDDGSTASPPSTGGLNKMEEGVIVSSAASRIFLATSLNGEGDLILCFLMNCRCDDAWKPLSTTSTTSDEGHGNSKVLRCYSLPRCKLENDNKCNDGSKMGASSLPTKEERTVTHLVDFPCLSAQPIQSTPVVPPPSYSDRYLPFSSKIKRKFSDALPLSNDILLCRVICDDVKYPTRIAQDATLSLFRAQVHVVDCAMSYPIRRRDTNLDADITRRSTGNNKKANLLNTELGEAYYRTDYYRVVGLDNSVCNRVDLTCLENGHIISAREKEKLSCETTRSTTNGRMDKFVTLRASVSLVFDDSPVTEESLLAIGSALLSMKTTETKYHDESSNTNDFCAGEECVTKYTKLATGAYRMTLLELYFKFRSDCARLVQAISLTANVANNTGGNLGLLDDISWSAFSTLFECFMDALLSCDSTLKVTDWLDKNSVANSGIVEKAMDDDDEDAAWESLLSSEFHQTYQEHKNFLFLDVEDRFLQREVNPKTDESKSNCNACVKVLSELTPSTFEWLARYISSPCPEERENDVKAYSVAFSAAVKMFDALHLLYEDAKLRKKSRGYPWLRALGSVLTSVCTKVGHDGTVKTNTGDSDSCHMIMDDFIDYYWRDIGDSLDNVQKTRQISTLTSAARLTSFLRPPNILAWVDSTFRRRIKGEVPDGTKMNFTCDVVELNGACSLFRIVQRLFSILLDAENECSSSDTQAVDRKIVLTMAEEGISDVAEIRDEFSPGIAIPLMEVLHRCKLDPPNPASTEQWPPTAYMLVGRVDLAEMQVNNRQHERLVLNDTNEHNNVRLVTTFDESAASAFFINDPENDGLLSLDSFSSMLFPKDNRVHKAASLVRSSRPSFLRVPRAVEVSDHDYERLKQEKLLLLCRRVLALPLGRGMMTIGTLRPLPAEPLPMPQICLAGRVPPTNATLALDSSNYAPDTIVWPEFHNGAAAGLRLPAASGSRGGKIDQITRTWILYNKPTIPPPNPSTNNVSPSQTSAAGSAQPSQVHGGLLMALGLRGHLSSLSMPDVYEYLTQGSVTTTVGILLGMSANKRATCDPSVSKMLCLHIPSLLPPTFAAMDVASPAQAAAVAGIGLLYQGSFHRLMTEFLLNEIGKLPTNDQNICDREGYTLSCGLALGMVNLSLTEPRDTTKLPNEDFGGSAGLDDLRIEERLHRYIVGGTDGGEARRRREAAECAHAASATAGGEPERCSRIYEGDIINTDVTAPGAIIALGLMYLRSGNKSVATRLALPDTHFLLDYVRPDLLLLRVLARSLVLWHDVEPSSKWIESQIPTIVRRSYDLMGKTAERASGFGSLANFATDATVLDGSPDEKTLHTGERPRSQKESRKRAANENKREDEHVEVDWQAIRQAHAHIVAGACFGMGLRYAGTGDSRASAAVLERILKLRKLREDHDPISLAQRPERPILEMCLGCAAISLAMIMAGTGDLETLVLFRALRWKCEEEVRYGNHMALSAAIGLLFLGGGSATLGRDSSDIAALIMAFFPRFPVTTSDNQYHLQALRHCYALAVKRRMVEAVDIDTKERVHVPLEVQYKDNSKIELTSPFLLLEKEKIAQIRVVSEKHYCVELNLKLLPTFDSHLSIFVKKKAGNLSYLQDADVLRSLLIQRKGNNVGTGLDSVQLFAEDPTLLAYAKYLCATQVNTVLLNSSSTQNGRHHGVLWPSVEEFCIDILIECLSQHKPEAIPLYLALRDSVAFIDKKLWPVGRIWDIRLVRSYYEGKRSSDSTHLIDPSFVAMLCEDVDHLFATQGYSGQNIMSYIKFGRHLDCFNNKNTALLGCFLVWNDVPNRPPSIGSEIIDEIEHAFESAGFDNS